MTIAIRALAGAKHLRPLFNDETIAEIAGELGEEDFPDFAARIARSADGYASQLIALTSETPLTPARESEARVLIHTMTGMLAQFGLSAAAEIGTRIETGVRPLDAIAVIEFLAVTKMSFTQYAARGRDMLRRDTQARRQAAHDLARMGSVKREANSGALTQDVAA